MEESLPGGQVGGATRVGRTVRRPSGPWTPAVHALLGHLHAVGLRGVPQVHGLDDQGREVLTYLEGRSVPVDREVVLESVLVEAVTWLRDLHDAVDDFRPAGLVRWRGGEAELEPDQIVVHNDPGTYNWIIEGGHFVGMVDWDMAGPGEALDDLAFLAWTAIPLNRPHDPADTARRLDLVAETYAECGPFGLLDAVDRRMQTACDRIAAGQERGDEGFLALGRAGEPQRTLERLADFRARRPEIEAHL